MFFQFYLKSTGRAVTYGLNDRSEILGARCQFIGLNYSSCELTMRLLQFAQLNHRPRAEP